MTQRIVIGGSAANPPHLGHQHLIERLLGCNQFSMVVWIPSGEREDKHNFVDPNHRAAMTQLTFPPQWYYEPATEFHVLFDDVYHDNTPAITWLERFQTRYPNAEVAWFTGSDTVWPDPKFGGQPEILRWHRADELLATWPFIILPRKDYPVPTSLPLQFHVLDLGLSTIASSEIRDRIREQISWEGLVTADVAKYIKRYGLYGYPPNGEGNER